jgi:hypothetical protein
LRADDYQLVISEDRVRDPSIEAFRSWILAAAKEPLAGIETPVRRNLQAGARHKRTRSDAHRGDK